MIEDEIWLQVEGISFDGLTFKDLLTSLVEGTITPELKEELLADCCRDWEASTAGYAAIPRLLKEGYPARLSWELAWTAGQTIAEGAMQDSPPVPDFLRDRVDAKMKALTIERLKQGMAYAGLNLVELIQTVSLIAALSGREALGGNLMRLSLLEKGLPRDYVDANFPPE